MKKKVLLIAGDFLPYSPSLGGVIRIMTLSDFLFRNGYDVHIIASKSIKFGYFGYEDLVGKFNVHYVENRLQSYIFKSTADKKAYLDGNSSSKKTPARYIRKIITAMKYRLKNTVLDFCVPDINIFMKVKFYKKATELIRNENIVNIIISSPPHSMQVVGTMIKRRLKSSINYIADYRDSWNTIKLFSKKNVISRLMSRHYEKQALLICDRFTYISSPMRAKVERLYGIDIANKSRLIMNGFVEETIGSEHVRSGRIKIGYFGAISDSPNSMRNISPLLEILELRPEEFSFLEFHFFGDVTISNHALDKLPMVFVHKSLDHKEALYEMLNSDFLLLVHSDSQSSDEVITGKFFEYVAAKKAIICLGPVDMEAKRLIARYGIGINIDILNGADIESNLKSLSKLDTTGYYKNLDVNIFKRDRQYETFLEILK